MLFNCKFCGGELEITEGLSVTTCKYCRTAQTLPKTSDQTQQNLFNRANALRRRCDFDKAEAAFERIVQADDTESEAYWGLVLCKYGIEYVEDPESGRMLPTCHRASYDSVVADEDYRSALEHADEERRAIYTEQAKEIDRIQKDILALARKEETYDVFICYKETDENGKRTRDSVIANELYYQLCDAGLKVFYAAVTLENKLGHEYEPIIFAALNSAKVMLVLGTKPEHFNAVWVKNEWSRYLKIMKKDRKKLLIPCYRDMDAYDLPDEFSHLQAQDMSRIGFTINVLNGIKKIMESFNTKPDVIIEKNETVIRERETVVREPLIRETTVIRDGSGASEGVSVSNLIERVFIFIEDSEWENAIRYCEKALDLDPKNTDAYLGKLLAELKVKKKEDLRNAEMPFDGNGSYKKIIRFGDVSLIEELKGYVDLIKDRNDKKDKAERDEAAYLKAMDDYKSYNNDRLKNAIDAFSSLGGYKDSAERKLKCEEKLERLIKKSEDEQREQERRLELKRQEEAEKRRLAEKAAEDERKRKELEAAEKAHAEAQRRRKKKTVITVLISAVCVVLAAVILINAVIIPGGKYSDAVALMKDGKYAEALTIFEALGGYGDSKAKAEECNIGMYGAATWEKIKDIVVGGTYTFGTYEQNNKTDDGKENITWLVLAKEGTRILVTTMYAIDCVEYGSSGKATTWETSTLREWLNETFINNAFTEEERAMIPTVTITNEDSNAGVTGGNSTDDRVFVLSVSEMKKYFATSDERRCKATKYAAAAGANASDTYVWWWLRSPGGKDAYAAFVTTSGAIDTYGQSVGSRTRGVRPAMWIDLQVNEAG